VVRMMVRIAEPKEGMNIYDPCSGSGATRTPLPSHSTPRAAS